LRITILLIEIVFDTVTSTCNIHLTHKNLCTNLSPRCRGRKVKEYIRFVLDWWSTLCKWRFCQFQSHVTQKLGQISKIWPNQI